MRAVAPAQPEWAPIRFDKNPFQLNWTGLPDAADEADRVARVCDGDVALPVSLVILHVSTQRVPLRAPLAQAAEVAVHTPGLDLIDVAAVAPRAPVAGALTVRRALRPVRDTGLADPARRVEEVGAGVTGGAHSAAAGGAAGGALARILA